LIAPTAPGGVVQSIASKNKTQIIVLEIMVQNALIF